MLNVFIGRPNNGADGEWVTLPTSKEKLEAVIDNRDYIISDYEKNYLSDAIHITEYFNVFYLNDIVSIVVNPPEAFQTEFKTLLLYCDGNIESVIDFISNKKYIFFTDVSTTEDLGEKIIEKRLLGFIPSAFKDYINYEEIGNDWECNGFIIYPQLRTALGQISDQDYIKYKNKGII